MKKNIIAVLATLSFAYCTWQLRFNDDLWALIPLVAQIAILVLTIGKDLLHDDEEE